ncbi:MAG: hypothetical protein EZS28_009437 [Streblomastix strix]|uniref:Uncharacterized protein n=1 Tax=Streblomastix strix TaxID=222440 RepID=A0A5J4WL02_9EUKA|nr:MAG: hypothetical protein EZS28_009437 [Streblomastix strix]
MEKKMMKEVEEEEKMKMEIQKSNLEDIHYIKQGREYVSVHPHPWPIRCIDVGHNPRSVLTTCGDCIYRADLRVNNPMSKIAVIHPDPCSTITQREHKQINQKRKLQNGLIGCETIG